MIPISAKGATMATSKNPAPTDSLWLAILEERADLREMSSKEAQRVLEEGGFPPALIKAYLAARQQSSSSRTKQIEKTAT